MFTMCSIFFFACSHQEYPHSNERNREISLVEVSDESEEERRTSKESNAEELQNSKSLTESFLETYQDLSYQPKNYFGRPPPLAPYRFNLPSGIAVDSTSGDFFVADKNNEMIQTLSLSSSQMRSGATSTQPAASCSMHGSTVPQNDNLLVYN